MSKKRKLEASEATHETAHKKSRHYSEQDRKLASLYDSLADELNDVRIKAAKDLLLELQPQKVSEKGNIIEIVMKRLIRGLCSGRKSARSGFFIALTELLRALYGKDSKHREDKIPPFEKIPELIESLTQPESNVAGQVSTSRCPLTTSNALTSL
jgi:DNA polymerase phi